MQRMMWLITDTLPYSQVKAHHFQLHISYFLQKCKKGKPGEVDLPFFENDITTIDPVVFSVP
jgi:hypothetical protein